MGLRDKASKVLGAIKQGDGRGAASALTDALDSARVRLMDRVVSRLSGHPVRTDVDRQDDFTPPPGAPPAEGPAPSPAPVEASPPAIAPEPASPAPEGPGSDDVPPADLPRGYRENRLVLLARDPTWAFAHWDFAPERIAALAEGLPDPRAVLRFYEVGSDAPLVDADVDPENGRYYLRVPRPGRTYEARLLLVGANGALREVARSNDAEPPSRAAKEGADAPTFVRMDAQTEVLDRADDVLVPPPRLVMNPAASAVEQPAFAPRNPRWAKVLFELRRRRLEERLRIGPLGTSPHEGWQTVEPGPSTEPAAPRPSLAAAFEAAPSSSAWVRPDPTRA